MEELIEHVLDNWYQSYSYKKINGKRQILMTQKKYKKYHKKSLNQ